MFFEQIDSISTNSSIISKEVQILTSNIDNLNANKITSATKVVGQIFNTSRNASPQVKLTRFFEKGGEERKKLIPNYIPYSRTWA